MNWLERAPVGRRPNRTASILPTIALLLAACVAPAPGASSPATVPIPSSSPAAPSAPASAPAETVTPAPGSDSSVYRPNPSAIVVVIDPGHGGCLDWGVPDPSQRGAEWAEKALTLAIALQLRDRLEADGISVVMTRDADVALAGDDYPDLGCSGPPWRDVDGDGQAGFEPSGRIRTRDELQARIDLANLVAADAFVSIHINALTQDGKVFEIAATQTFYDDETPWGADSEALADVVQAGVVDAIDPLATAYDRQDRGTQAVAYYVISRAWDATIDSCEEPGDTWCKPHRALQMPAILSEVGSITLRAEHDLLASADGQSAIAGGLFEGLAAFMTARGLGGRVALATSEPGNRPTEIDGRGPPFVAPLIPDGPLRLRITNTGNERWPAGMTLLAGWQETDLPYLPAAPALRPLPVDLPRLEPGESMVVIVALPAPPAGRAVAWIGLGDGSSKPAAVGLAPLQLLRGPR